MALMRCDALDHVRPQRPDGVGQPVQAMAALLRVEVCGAVQLMLTMGPAADTRGQAHDINKWLLMFRRLRERAASVPLDRIQMLEVTAAAAAMDVQRGVYGVNNHEHS